MWHTTLSQIAMQDRSHVPDGHARAGNLGELNGARETFISLGVVILEADLKLDGLKKLSLLLVGGVFK